MLRRATATTLWLGAVVCSGLTRGPSLPSPARAGIRCCGSIGSTDWFEGAGGGGGMRGGNPPEERCDQGDDGGDGGDGAGRAARRSAPPAQLRRFAAGEFQINRYIGGLGFLEITDWEYYGVDDDMRRGSAVRVNPLDPATPTRTTTQSGTSVRLFEAFMSDGRRVLLKEYFPPSRQLALGEAAAVLQLQDAWARTLAPTSRTSAGILETELSSGVAAERAAEFTPFVTLKGCIEGSDVFASKDFIRGWRRSFPEVAPPLPRNLWLVYKWEGFGNTVLNWPRQTQEWLALDAIMPRIRLQRRLRFVAATMRSALGGVAFLHEASIVHRSLSGASLLLSTSDDRITDPERIAVKISDLGFATTIADAATDPELLRRARALGCANSPFEITAFVTGEDLHALGLAFLELFFSSLVSKEADRGSEGLPADQATFQRLYTDVFEGDILRLRDYCNEEPAWEQASAFLAKDGYSGWYFFDLLLSARKVGAPSQQPQSAPFPEAPQFLDPTARLVTARALMQSPFLDQILR